MKDDDDDDDMTNMTSVLKDIMKCNLNSGVELLT
jgi:hypothetical protein